VLDLRKRGVGPDAVQALWGATLSWAGYGRNIESNPQAAVSFIAANNDAIAWIQDSRNRSTLYATIKKHMPLPGDTSDPDSTLKRIVDVNAAGLGAGVPKESIEGWNKYLIFLKQIEKPIPYDELVWKTGRL
jgi:ABC-type nitrate/sulfonate/bicarbonate transport system substrate-binding protein